MIETMDKVLATDQYLLALRSDDLAELQAAKTDFAGILTSTGMYADPIQKVINAVEDYHGIEPDMSQHAPALQDAFLERRLKGRPEARSHAAEKNLRKARISASSRALWAMVKGELLEEEGFGHVTRSALHIASLTEGNDGTEVSRRTRGIFKADIQDIIDITDKNTSVHKRAEVEKRVLDGARHFGPIVLPNPSQVDA